MGSLIPIVSLLVVVTLGLIVTRIGAIALTLTGLSRDVARFQARSAFTGVGFTTSESENILEHPLRRRIIMLLMWLGNAGLIASVSSLLPVFVGIEEGGLSFMARILWLLSGLVLLWVLATSKWLDRQMSRVIEWSLKRWTHLDIRDYPSLLRVGEGYSVCEVKVEAGDWVAGKALSEIRLGDEGVQVLGIRRVNGDYVGAPSGKTYVRAEDTLMVYGKTEHVAEIDNRRAGRGGDAAHEERVAEVRRTMVLQEDERIRKLRKDLADNGPSGPEAKP